MACTDINNILVAESGRISPEIYKVNLFSGSPWLRLVEAGKWPEGMGSTISTLVYERALPATTPTWADFSPNTGAGQGSCNLTATKIDIGKTARQYNLQGMALESQDICLDDLIYDFARTEQLSKTIDTLAENTRYAWDNRFRDEYIRVSTHKVIARTGLPEGAAAFPSVVPNSYLTNGILRSLTVKMTLDSAAVGAIDRINGAPVWTLITDGVTSENIIKNEDAIRQDFRWSTRANELLAPLNIQRIYGSFIHTIDNLLPRYDWVNGAYVRRYPFSKEDTTYGNSEEISALYLNAAYQVSVIYNTKVMKNLMPSKPGVVGGMSYPAQNYSGDFEWKNILDRDCNPDGKIGYFRGLFYSATQPIHVRYGYAIMHQICPMDLGLTTCTTQVS